LAASSTVHRFGSLKVTIETIIRISPHNGASLRNRDCCLNLTLR
jgi:hypothetical protein